MQLILKNFRAVQEARVDLAPVTLVYGPNGTGKSTLLYAPVVLRNIVMNPAQGIPAFFNLRAVNLGGLTEVVFDHDASRELELGISYQSGQCAVGYRVALWGETSGRFTLSLRYVPQWPQPSSPHRKRTIDAVKALEESKPSGILGSPVDVTLELEVSFPYPANSRSETRFDVEGGTALLVWNGIAVVEQDFPPRFEVEARDFIEAANSPLERLRKTTFVPLIRGFFKPLYSRVPVTGTPLGEEEVASWIEADRYFDSRISSFLERIAGRQFVVRGLSGTGLFSLITRDARTALGVDLVNEGFGVNQLVYLLAKSLHRDSELICIEEPEIHLHPGAIRRLARVIGEIALQEGKTFLISTHSEALVTAFLAEVAAGRMKPVDLACYASLRQGKAVRFERRAVNERGQVEGGLESFMEGEEEVTKALLGAAYEASDDSGAGRVGHP